MAIECSECPDHAAICCPDCGKDYYLRDTEANAEIARLTAALADANTSVIAFGSIWAVQYAKDHGFPDGHLAPNHYDILAKAGARMDGFSRAKDMEAGNG